MKNKNKSYDYLWIVPLGTNLLKIFIQENTFENDVCKMHVILSRPQCVKDLD